MSNLRVNQVVRVYGVGEDLMITGRITDIRFVDMRVWVTDINNGAIYSVHAKQCRKLKPKKMPLRIEGTVSWAEKGGVGYVSPVSDAAAGTTIGNSIFRQFLGKRTKITVEVLDE